MKVFILFCFILCGSNIDEIIAEADYDQYQTFLENTAKFIDVDQTESEKQNYEAKRQSSSFLDWIRLFIDKFYEISDSYEEDMYTSSNSETTDNVATEMVYTTTKPTSGKCQDNNVAPVYISYCNITIIMGSNDIDKEFKDDNVRITEVLSDQQLPLEIEMLPDRKLKICNSALSKK